MAPARRAHGVRSSIHEIGAVAAVDMQVNEPWRDIAPLCVKHLVKCVSLRRLLSDRFNDAVPDRDASILDHFVR
jgi:hypothetical protein